MAEPRDYPSLLRGLLPGPVDPGYARAHTARGGRPARGRSQVLALALGAALVGLVLGISAADAVARAPGAEQVRRELADELQAARSRTDELSERAGELNAQLHQAQERHLTGSAQGRTALDTQRRLELETGAVPVSGPGLRITVADGEARHAVLDRDLQVLVNGVWAAGAEAVALGGVRLHPRATVRQAGGAMLVDNRPVGQPYVLEAIGDPAGLHTGLVQNDGYGRFAALAQLYGTRLDIDGTEALALPAATPALPQLAHFGGDR